MLPNFFVEEITVRECGESAPFPLGEDGGQRLLLTLGITHATEQESLDVDVYASEDGEKWVEKPIAGFPRKFYCGTYQMVVPPGTGRYLRAVWRVSRWGRGENRPFFRFYVFAQVVRARAMAGAA